MKRGFTLLEILIVVAIIATLSGIVFIFVSSALTASADSVIKSSLGSLRQEAGIFFNDETLGRGSYRPALPYTSTIFTYCGAVAFEPTALGPGPNNPSNLYKSRSLIRKAAEAAGVSMTATSNATRCRILGIGPNAGQIPVTGGWIAAVVLRSSTVTKPTFWCVDSSGNSKRELGAINSILTSSPVNLTRCP